MKIKLIILILVLISTSGFSQEIEGKFNTAYGEGTRTLSFTKHNFKDEISQSLGKDYGSGSYKVRKNHLHLTYKKIPNQEVSTFSIVTEAMKTDSTKLLLSASDDTGLGIKATITIIDNDRKILKQLSADQFGKGNFIFKNDNQARYLLVACPGYHTVQIPIAKLENKSSTISVRFKESEVHYKEPHSEVYEIKKLTYDELVLSSPNEKEVKFKRVKKNNN